MKRLVLLAPSVVVLGCGLPFGVDDDELPLLRTTVDEYVVELGEHWAELEVPYAFTNRTDVTVHVGGCRGVITPVFDRWVDDEWKATYQSPSLDCGASPRAVLPGEVLTEAAALSWRITSDTTAWGRYVPGSISGRYRLRWDQAASSPFGGGAPSPDNLLPEALTVSNDFTLSEAPNQ